jgi:hypothetical protein
MTTRQAALALLGWYLMAPPWIDDPWWRQHDRCRRQAKGDERNRERYECDGPMPSRAPHPK